MKTGDRQHVTHTSPRITLANFRCQGSRFADEQRGNDGRGITIKRLTNRPSHSVAPVFKVSPDGPSPDGAPPPSAIRRREPGDIHLSSSEVCFVIELSWIAEVARMAKSQLGLQAITELPGLFDRAYGDE